MNHVANFLSAAGGTTRQNKSVRALLRPKIINVNLIKERKAGLKRRLNALDAKLLCLKIEYVLIRCVDTELDAKAGKLGENLESDLGAVSQQSENGVV